MNVTPAFAQTCSEQVRLDCGESAESAQEFIQCVQQKWPECMNECIVTCTEDCTKEMDWQTCKDNCLINCK